MNLSIRIFVLIGLFVSVHVGLSAQKKSWPFVDSCETSGSYTSDHEYRSGYRLRDGKIIWKLSK